MSVKAICIIPCLSLSELTLSTLDSLRHLGHETIVVVDGPRDETPVSPPHARVLWTGKRRGPAFARNLGARAASGDILVFVDSDVAAGVPALRGLIAHLAQRPALAAAFGSYDASPHAPGLASQYRNLLHHFVHQSSRCDASTFWSGFGAIRADIFKRVGGFDERYEDPSIEDIELGTRICALGYEIGLCKELQVTHRKAWTLLSILHTDLFRRAIPWAELLASGRARFSADLNLSVANRLGVALVAGQLVFLASPCIAIAITLLYLLVSARVIWFFARARGPLFAAGSTVLLWAHHLTCLAGLCAGTAISFGKLVRGERRRGEIAGSVFRDDLFVNAD